MLSWIVEVSITEQVCEVPSKVHDNPPLRGKVAGSLTSSLVLAGKGMVEVNCTRTGESTPRLGVTAVTTRLVIVCSVKLKFLVSEVYAACPNVSLMVKPTDPGTAILLFTGLFNTTVMVANLFCEDVKVTELQSGLVAPTEVMIEQDPNPKFVELTASTYPAPIGPGTVKV